MDKDGWWRGAVIYQIYPRSFLDTNGDGIGDLKGIVRQLDYVESLGVDAIWLSPFYPSPMDDFGYDVTEHCGVDPQYGEMSDFEKLVEEAHARNLKVIIDAVLNHTSDQHPWFEESRKSRDNPKADWYQWQDPKPDGSPPNNWISRFAESQWTWEPTREQYYRHQYMQSQPALDLANPDVLEARLGFMRYWLDKGVDGIRFDAVTQYFADPDLKDNPPADPEDDEISPVGRFSTFAWQKHINDANDDRVETFLRKLIHEVECAGCTFCYGELDTRINAYDNLDRYTGEGLLTAAYTPDFMEIGLEPSGIERIIGALKSRTCLMHHVWAASNHDSARLVSRWGPEDADRATQDDVSRLAAALLVCLPGEISFLQGEELGLPNADYAREELKDPQGIRFHPKAGSRDRIRHPFPWDASGNAGFSQGEPWLPVKTPLAERNAASQGGDKASVLHHWRRMISLRQTNATLKLGDVEVVEADDATGILRLRRSCQGETIEAVFCTGTEGVACEAGDGQEIARSQNDLGTPFSFVITKS